MLPWGKSAFACDLFSELTDFHSVESLRARNLKPGMAGWQYAYYEIAL
jgi:hypothetical protein